MVSFLENDEIRKKFDQKDQDSPGDVKRIYRDLVRIYHPDVHPDPDLAKEMFIRITTVYQDVLNRIQGREEEGERVFVHGKNGMVERRGKGGKHKKIREVSISPDIAYMGGNITIKTREGAPLTIEVPPRTENGTVVKYRHVLSKQLLKLRLVYEVPSDVSEEVKKYMENMS